MLLRAAAAPGDWLFVAGWLPSGFRRKGSRCSRTDSSSRLLDSSSSRAACFSRMTEWRGSRLEVGTSAGRGFAASSIVKPTYPVVSHRTIPCSVVHEVQGLLQVFPRFPFGALIVRPQQVRRVICDDDRDVLPIKPLATHLGDPFLVACKSSRRGAPQGADGLGPDGHQLTVEKLPANLHFVRFRCAVLRRPALYHVADVHILAQKLDAFLLGGVLDHLGEQLAGPPDEGNPLGVFIRAGAFPHKYQGGALIADAEDDLVAALVEAAAPAIADIGEDLE